MAHQPATDGDITMKKNLATHGLITLVLGLITFLWLLFHLHEIRADLPGVLRFDLSHYSNYITGAGYLIMLLFHIAAFIFMFKEARFTKRIGGWQVLALVLGVSSLFAIAVEKVMYDEIAHELFVEYPVPNEIVFLYACLAVNVIFSIAMMALTYRALLRAPSPTHAPAPKDERVFILAQVMGIVSGITGLFLTIALSGRGTPSDRFWIFIPFYALFLIPYALAVLYWLAIKRRERLVDWYDEKQIQDVLKASLTTLLLSIPGLAFLALIRRPLHFYWFLYYLFLILSLFSASTLYYFKKE
jgi:hypothetical protein